MRAAFSMNIFLDTCFLRKLTGSFIQAYNCEKTPETTKSTVYASKNNILCINAIMTPKDGLKMSG